MSGGGNRWTYPFIAIANELKRRFLTNFLFVGAQDKMEMQEDYPSRGIK
jgi:hypothetical protein